MKMHFIFLLPFLIFSCSTFKTLDKTIYIPKNSVSYGNICNKSSQNISGENDILYEGKLKPAWSSSLIYLNIAYSNDIDAKKWTGTVVSDENEKNIEVTFWHNLSKTSKRKIKILKIEGFDDFLKIECPKLSDDYLYSKNFPQTVFSFKSNNKKYSVKMTKIKIPAIQTEGVCNETDTFLLPEQVFIIQNSRNEVLAQFTEFGFQLFSENDFENGICKDVIEFCMILRDICKKVSEL